MMDGQREAAERFIERLAAARLASLARDDEALCRSAPTGTAVTLSGSEARS
jgi:hypothetical protein